MKPDFDASKKKILFFSRGRGRAHAICDMEIAAAVGCLSSETEIRLVSYGTGSETLRCHGTWHIDLRFPDNNPINETIVSAGRLIGGLDPDLVVAHEEFSALPAAKIFSKPTVLITDWFTHPERLSMGALRCADRIIFLDAPGIYPEPPWVAGKVHYIGPVLRKFRYQRCDRERARSELGIPAEAVVLTVLPGSWRECDVPIADRVLEALDLFEHDPPHLIWVAGADADEISRRTSGRANVLIRGYDPAIDRIMAATDVAITKCNRKTLMELTCIGIPSISFANDINPIDLFRAHLFPHHRMLGADAPALEMVDALRAALEVTPSPGSWPESAETCARLILEAFPPRVSAGNGIG